MLQRIQSIFLLLAAAGFGSLLKLPIATSTQSEAPLFQDKVFNAGDHTVLLVLAIAGVVLCLFSIFKFKNRNLQLRLGYISMILAFFMALVAIWLVYGNASQWTSDLAINDGVGIYVAAVIIVLLVLSNRFISKDEKTIRSMDRLR